MHIVQQHAFLVDMTGEGRHATRREAADVRVMAAGGEVKQRFSVFIEPGANHRHVRQMGAAIIRIVQHIDIPWFHGRAASFNDGAHARAHAA